MTAPVLDFASLQVRDLETSRAFYTEVLGFHIADERREGAVVFKDAGGAIFAIRTPLVDLSASPKLGWGAGLWFGVGDPDALHDRALAAGALVLHPPQDGPFGRMFVLADPDGYALTFHARG